MNRTLLALLCLSLAPAAISAEPTPAAITAYREVEMSALGKHMKAINILTKGELDRPAYAAGHADAIAAIARTLGELFPAGTGPGVQGIKTEAKAEIWSKPTEFAAAVTAFQTESAKLSELSHGTDFAAFTAQVGVVGKSCGSCHDSFKIKD